MVKRLVVSLVLFVGGVHAGWAANEARAVEQSDGVYVDAACPFELPGGLVDGEEISCGYLAVPMIHGQNGGEMVRLAVATIRSTAAQPASEPLVLLLGGPGQEVESILPAFAPSSPVSYRSLLERQDVILLDLRGIGYSEPSLACPFDAVGGEAATVDPAAFTEPVAAFGTCAEELRETGIDFEAFDSVQSAADIDALRGALGYDRIDVLGISYGSRLALTVVRDFPETVRSVILASPLPLQANVVAGQILSFDAALDQLFAECAADGDCSARYPDLDATLATAVAQLDAEPILLQTENPLSGEPAEIVVDGTAFLGILYVATFVGPLLQFVPALIDGVVSGNTFVLETLAPFTLVFTEGVSLGANYVYNCNDEFAFTNATEVERLVAEEDIRPEVAAGDFAGSFDAFAICDEFEVAPAPARENTAVESDVPALILAGEFDPITPPDYGEAAASTLPNSFSVVFAGVAHDPLSTAGTCGFAIVGAFLAEPSAAPDATCASEAPLSFVVVPE